MSTRLKPYIDAIGVLRYACRPQRDLTDTDLAQQASTYARALAAYHPGDVREACEDWASRVKWFPELAELLALVREKQAVREAAARPRLEPPKQRPRPQPTDGEILERWKANDQLYEGLIRSPETWPPNRETLAHVYETIRGRRWLERPDLASRYYLPAADADLAP